MPTLSMTMTMRRRKGGVAVTPLLVREVVGNRLGGFDGGDRVLEDQVIDAALVEDQGEPIEILDPPLELAAVHHPDRDRQLLAPHVVEEYVLDVRLRFGFRGGCHQGKGSCLRASTRRLTAAMV